MIVGTAGHVDHGKTSLVRALTGVDTDRLAEEKTRGISIELGFAYASLGGPHDDERDDPRAAAEAIGFVDVPGHRRFVQTMIAGASGVDVGLLVVAADDGPMPQTREHLDILRWLGVRDLVVALNKIDAVDAARRDTARAAIETLLDGTPYREATIVPVSTVSGDGIDALKAVLVARRDDIAGRRAPADAGAGRRFRMAIDRVFVLQGIGLIATGTCGSGRIAIDDSLTLLPDRLGTRVRGIHAQNRPVREAHAGQRIAVNLAGRGVDKSSVNHGDWIVDPSIAVLTDRIDVRLIAGSRTQSASPAFAPLDARHWRDVRFHAGAASCNARVVLLDEAPDPEADEALAQIAFERAIHLLAGDRFVLRDGSVSGEDGASGSIAGGIVLDVDVPTRGRRSDARLRFLRIAASGDDVAALADAVDNGVKGVDLVRWNLTHNAALDADAVPAHAVGGAIHADRAPGITLFSIARWDALLAHVVDVLRAEHVRAPDTVGPGRDRLRRMATPSLDAAAFTALVDALKGVGRLSQTGAWLHLPDHRVELSPDDRLRFERALPSLRGDAEANPPRVRDLARAQGEDEATMRSLFIRLAARGDVYRIAHDHYFLPATVQGLARAAADVAADDGVARAAPFRDRIGVGRKVAVQILEFFDRVGYTRRVGDDHRIVQPTLFDD